MQRAARERRVAGEIAVLEPVVGGLGSMGTEGQGVLQETCEGI